MESFFPACIFDLTQLNKVFLSAISNELSWLSIRITNVTSKVFFQNLQYWKYSSATVVVVVIFQKLTSQLEMVKFIMTSSYIISGKVKFETFTEYSYWINNQVLFEMTFFGVERFFLLHKILYNKLYQLNSVNWVNLNVFTECQSKFKNKIK